MKRLSNLIKTHIYKLVTKARDYFNSKGFQGFPGVMRVARVVKRLVKPTGTILVDNHGMKMYINCPYEYYSGAFQEFETDLFIKALEPGMIVVDIGANVGYYSLLAANLVETTGVVYAFEPEPNNFELFKKNLQMNNVRNVETFQVAVSNKNSRGILYISEENLGTHSFCADNVVSEAGNISVDTITLDGFFSNELDNIQVDLIKMDTQGAEGLIIRGAVELLARNDLKIFMEFWPEGLRNTETEPVELLRTLERLGYVVSCIDNEEKCLRRLTPLEIIEVCEHSNDGYVNLWAEK